MDLEPGGRAFSGGDSNCRSLSRSPAPLGGGSPTVSAGGKPTENLDEDPPEASAGQRKNRKTAGRAAGHRNHKFTNGREDPRRGRLLRKKCGTDAHPGASMAANMGRRRPGVTGLTRTK